MHRDAERQRPEVRFQEIMAALARAELDAMPAVRVVPVRMTEAWFLFDEAAIRMASGNPRGRTPLALPAMDQVDAIDAKQALYTALQSACGVTGRRLNKFSPAQAVYRLAESIDDFSPLRRLPAFEVFERELTAVVLGLEGRAARTAD